MDFLHPLFVCLFRFLHTEATRYNIRKFLGESILIVGVLTFSIQALGGVKWQLGAGEKTSGFALTPTLHNTNLWRANPQSWLFQAVINYECQRDFLKKAERSEEC